MQAPDLLLVWDKLLWLPGLLHRETAAENAGALAQCFAAACSAALPHLQTGMLTKKTMCCLHARYEGMHGGFGLG